MRLCYFQDAQPRRRTVNTLLKTSSILAVAILVMSAVSIAPMPEPGTGAARSLVLAQDAPPAPDPAAERLKSQFESRLKRLAGDHEKFGNKYQKAGDIPEAIKQYRFAIYLDTDHAQARKAMGYVRRDGRWFIDSLLTPEPDVDPSKLSEAERKKHEEKLAKIDEASAKVDSEVNKHGGKAGKDMLEWHGKLSKAGATEHAARALVLAAWFMPDDKDINEARGFLLHKGVYRHPRLASQVDAAAKAIADVPKGKVMEGEDPQQSALNLTALHRQKHDDYPYASRSTTSESRAGRILQVMLGIDARVRAVLATDKKPNFRSGVFTLSEFKSKQEFSDFINKYDTSDDKRKEFILKLSGTGSNNPYGFVTWHTNSGSGDDMAAHNVAVALMENLRRRQTDPWVGRGFGYMMTGQMLGTTATRFYTITEKKGRTEVRGKDSEPVFRRERSGPDRMRQICVEMLLLDQDITFHELSKTHTNDMTERHVSKSLGLMEMLLCSRPEAFSKWLMEGTGAPDQDLKNLLGVLGMEDADLQKAWQDWVLAHY
jgi:hypothetical protein